METHALNVAQAIKDFEPKKDKNGETMNDEEWDALANDERNLLEKRRRGRFATIQVPKPSKVVTSYGVVLMRLRGC